MYRDYTRENPELDAEEYANRGNNRPILDTCPVCGEPVYGGNDEYNPDDAYEIDGSVVHDDCVIEYLNRNGYKI